MPLDSLVEIPQYFPVPSQIMPVNMSYDDGNIPESDFPQDNDMSPESEYPDSRPRQDGPGGEEGHSNG